MLIELTRENSAELLGTCLGRFLHCSFLSLDLKYNVPVPAKASELTGGPGEKYEVMRAYILDNNMAAVYAGIVAYYDSRNKTRYTAYSYAMYVRHPGIYRKAEEFDMATLTKLDRERFDLNAYFKRAVPYLNTREEERLRIELNHYAVVPPAQRSAIFHEHDSFIRKQLKNKRIKKFVMERCHEVNAWLEQARPGESLVLEGTDYRDTMAYYILRKEIIGLFRTVWTSARGFKMCVDNVQCMRRGKYETDEFKMMKPEGFVVDALTTFRRLVRHLLTLEVPVVGHDLLLALMVLYNMVEAELPETYESFVCELGMRGTPHDTRRLAEAMRVECLPPLEGPPPPLDLDPTFRYLRNGAGLPVTCGGRFVVAAVGLSAGRPVETSDTRLKFAGEGDAYKAGYIYAKLEHFLTQRGVEMFPLFPSRSGDATNRVASPERLESPSRPIAETDCEDPSTLDY